MQRRKLLSKNHLENFFESEKEMGDEDGKKNRDEKQNSLFDNNIKYPRALLFSTARSGASKNEILL